MLGIIETIWDIYTYVLQQMDVKSVNQLVFKLKLDGSMDRLFY